MNRTHLGKAALVLAVAASLAACQQRQEDAAETPAAATPDVNITTPPDVNVNPPADVNINPPDVSINPPDVDVTPTPGTITKEESTTVTVPGVGSTTTTTTEKR